MTKLEEKKICVKDTIIQIAKMIASGKLPKELYDEYLSDTPIGFMGEDELICFLTRDISIYEDIHKEDIAYIKSMEKDLDKYKSNLYTLDEAIVELINKFRKVRGF